VRVAFRLLALLAALLGAASLAAQENGPAVVFQAFGGGAGHLRDLNSSGSAADFKLGFTLGIAIGLQANDHVALHGDFTYTRNVARGASSFAGAKIDRLYYGAHVELSYPTEGGFAPFVFGGGGAVEVQEAASVTTLVSFTKPAVMFGAGLRYQIPGVPVELLAEGKSLIYRWEGGGFSRTQWDLSYAVGLAYRMEL
jgi:opacity protein-like surface antigen